MLIKNRVSKEKKIIKKLKLSPSLNRGKKNAEKTKAEPGSGCKIIKIDGNNKYKVILSSVRGLFISD